MSADISKYLDPKNLHHAYLIEGERDEIVPKVLKFIDGKYEVIKIETDAFKMNDARNLKSYAGEKSYEDKKIFIIAANGILLEAQNSLLKMLEEPIENTHFFVVVPDTNSLLKTFVSRFYLIRSGVKESGKYKEAEEFISMPLIKRIDFLKELLVAPEEEDEEGNEIAVMDSTRSQALRFLNELELVLHKKFVSKKDFDAGFFEHFFKVRKYLRMPGSSAKNLMESVALVIPEKV